METLLQIKSIPVSQLKPAEYNPRKDLQPGNPEYEKINRSMNTFGYVVPIVWNEVTGNVVGGHQRLKMLMAEGVEEVTCSVVHIDDMEAEKALNVALNKAVGDWDQQSLEDLLRELRDAGYDMDVTGFDEDELEEIFAEKDQDGLRDDNTRLEAETILPFVHKGDLWYLGTHRMYCGDATSSEALNTLMGGAKANLVLTDPPYNVSYESPDGKSIQNDSMEDKKFHDFLLSSFRNWVPHLAEGASAYIFHADTEGLNFRTAFQEAGFHIAGVCVWVKNTLVLGRSPYQWQHEPVLFGWLPNGQHQWFADENQSSVWLYDKPKQSREHPTMKPLPLLGYPLKNSTEPNAVVLDTFGGSGSTLIACEMTNRICYTMELDERYASVIVMRYAELVGTDQAVDEITVIRNGRQLSYSDVIGI